MRFSDYLIILRPAQWYKNLVVFLAVFFSINLFRSTAVWLSFLGFVCLCLASASVYIINDVADKKRDLYNSEKKNRPIAAGRITTLPAIATAILLLLVSLFVSYSLSVPFFLLILVLTVLSHVYTFWLKHELFADILVIGCNFVLRAVSGALLIHVVISPWLVLCPFFLALFLATGKRHAEALLLRKQMNAARPILAGYTPAITQPLLCIITSLLLVSYSLYSLQRNTNLLYTLPFAIYVVLKQSSLILAGNAIARKPELVFWDRRMMTGILLWVVSAGVALYV